MKSTLLFVALLSLMLAGTQALAQDPGDIGLFFDVGGMETTGTIEADTPFFLYLVAFDAPGGISGYEGSLELPPNYLFFTPFSNPLVLPLTLGPI